MARHLVAAGMLIDEDPEQALAHARFARRRASRIALVREAAGIAAYHAGEWAEALGELRAARRMGGGPGHLAVMADIERALGRPERALELTRSSEARGLGRAESIELAIVAAGARRDLGELDVAVVGLQIPELDPARREPWSPRLFYAYADNLLAAGRDAEALQWFVHAADVDEDGATDADSRIAELTGEPLPDDDVEFDVVELGPETAEADELDPEVDELDPEVDELDREVDELDREVDELDPETAEASDQTAPDQTAPDQTAPDQTAPDQTEPDQTAPGDTEGRVDGPAEQHDPAPGVPDDRELTAATEAPGEPAAPADAAEDAATPGGSASGDTAPRDTAESDEPGHPANAEPRDKEEDGREPVGDESDGPAEHQPDRQAPDGEAPVAPSVELASDGSAPAEPTATEPTAMDSMSGESATSESTIGERAAGEPVTNEPAAGEPATGKQATAGHAAGPSVEEEPDR